MYILEDDIDGFDFIKIAQGKSAERSEGKNNFGLFRSFSLSQTLIAGLKEAGAEVFFSAIFSIARTERF